MRRGAINTGTNTGWRGSGPPVDVGAASSNHTHPAPYQAGFGQGISVDDSTRAVTLGIPEFAVSRDSIFWVNPDGRSYGCPR